MPLGLGVAVVTPQSIAARGQRTRQGEHAIAGAVIGGTSLFGGRGSASAALRGAVVIGAILNGMTLLQFESNLKFIITGSVLLVANHRRSEPPRPHRRWTRVRLSPVSFGGHWRHDSHGVIRAHSWCRL